MSLTSSLSVKLQSLRRLFVSVLLVLVTERSQKRFFKVILLFLCKSELSRMVLLENVVRNSIAES